MSAHTPGPRRAVIAREIVTTRLRKFTARELPTEIAVKTSIALANESNHTIAGFVMGGGFALEVAQEIARRVNAHEDLLAACNRALSALNDGGAEFVEYHADDLAAVRAAIARAVGE